MAKKTRQHGFTLVELMVALMVASVILSAVATLAYATTSAQEVTDNLGREQAQLRQVSIRLADLFKRANQVYQDGGGFYAYDWGVRLCFDLNADGDYDDTDETTVIYGDNGRLRIYWPGETAAEVYTLCQNPTFQYGWEDGCPRTVAIWFDVDTNGQTQQYSISARMRVSDDY